MPVNPSDAEQGYIKRDEIEKLKRTRTEHAKGMAKGERERLKQLHWMHCPKCGMELAEIDYRGVSIDACFSCGGMFLDKGEAEKIVGYKEPGWLDTMVSSLFGA